MTIRDQISSIGDRLHLAHQTNRVVIHEDAPDGFQVKHGYYFYQRLWDWCHIFFDENYSKENRATIDYLKKVFGDRKIEFIDKKFNLHLDYKHDRGLPLTVADIEKIFAGASLVYYQDLEVFFEDVKKLSASDSYLHLDSLELARLKTTFGARNFTDLTNPELKQLYQAMIPFNRIETIFLNNVPQEEFGNGSNPAAEFKDLQKFIYSYETLRRRGIEVYASGDEMAKKRYNLFYQLRMMKKLMNYNNDKNLVFDSPKGLLYHHDSFEAGGAFVAAMKAVKPDVEAKHHSAFYFLPTQCLNRVPQPWESLADDLRLEIGAWGAKSIMKKIKRHLLASAGFVKHDEQIDVFGYSLGGNQAARVVCALYPEGRIRKLYITSNPGIDQETADYFKGLVDAHEKQMKIVFSGELDDHTMRYGTCHLGAGCDPALVKIRYQVLEKIDPATTEPKWKPYKAEEIRSFPRIEMCDVDAFAQAGSLLRSINGPHTREYIEEQTVVHVIKNYPDKLIESESAEEIKQKGEFLNRLRLVNTGYGWEEGRLAFLQGVFARMQSIVQQRTESFVAFLQSVHSMA
jgi:hypothetical protein